MKKPSKLLLILMLLTTAIAATACVKQPEITAKSTVYDLNLTYSEGVLEGFMEIQFSNPLQTELSELKFALFANAHAATAEAEEPSAVQSAYPLTLNVVTVAGKPLEVSYELDNQLASVALPAPLAAGETTFVSMEYTLTVPSGNDRLGITKNGVNLANCYPQLCVLRESGWQINPYYTLGDPFVFDCADYYVALSVEGDYLLSAAGKTVDSYNKDGAAHYEIEGARLREFAAVLTSSAVSVSERVGDTDVAYTYFDDDSPATTLATAVLALKTFCDAFGDYPYSTLTVAQADFCEGGMEYPTLVFVTKTADYSDYLNAVVHEIAHQWWYAVVGSDQVNAPWLDESLAEFSTALYHKLNGNAEGYYTAVNGALTRYAAVEAAAKRQEISCSSMRVTLADCGSKALYVALVYDKGLLMWDSVYKCVGEKTVLKALKTYFEDNAYALADEQKLLTAFEKHKKGSSEIIVSWLDGSVVVGG